LPLLRAPKSWAEVARPARSKKKEKHNFRIALL
jgi:hypothetical protein